MGGTHSTLDPNKIVMGPGCFNYGCKVTKVPPLPLSAGHGQWQISNLKGIMNQQKDMCSSDKWPNCPTTNNFQKYYPTTDLGKEFSNIMNAFQTQYESGQLCVFNSFDCMSTKKCDPTSPDLLGFLPPLVAVGAVVVVNMVLEGALEGPGKLVVSAAVGATGYYMADGFIDRDSVSRQAATAKAAKFAGAAVGGTGGGIAGMLIEAADLKIAVALTAGGAAVGYFVLGPVMEPFMDLTNGLFGGLIADLLHFFVNGVIADVFAYFKTTLCVFESVFSNPGKSRLSVENVGGWAARILHPSHGLSKDERDAAFNCLLSSQKMMLFPGAGYGTSRTQHSIWSGNSSFSAGYDGIQQMVDDTATYAKNFKLPNPLITCLTKAQANPKARWGLHDLGPDFKPLISKASLLESVYNLSNLEQVGVTARTYRSQYQALFGDDRTLQALALLTDNVSFVPQTADQVLGSTGTLYTSMPTLGDCYQGSAVLRGAMPEYLTSSKKYQLQTTLENWYGKATSDTQGVVTRMQQYAVAQKQVNWNMGPPYSVSDLRVVAQVNANASSIMGRASLANAITKNLNNPDNKTGLVYYTLLMWQWMAYNPISTVKTETVKVLSGIGISDKWRREMAATFLEYFPVKPGKQSQANFNTEYAKHCTEPDCSELVALWTQYKLGQLPVSQPPQFSRRVPFALANGLQKTIRSQGVVAY